MDSSDDDDVLGPACSPEVMAARVARAKVLLAEMMRPKGYAPLSPEAAAKLRAGLESAKRGEVADLGSFQQYLSEEDRAEIREGMDDLRAGRKHKLEDVLAAIETEREDDGRWIADVPALPGVMAYGKTEEQAVADVRALAEAVEGQGYVVPDHLAYLLTLPAEESIQLALTAAGYSKDTAQDKAPPAKPPQRLLRTRAEAIELATAKFRALYTLALDVLSAEDPEGLLRIGAPEDEYDPEAEDLACRMMSGETIDAHAILDMHGHWFGYEEAPRLPMDVAERIAGALSPILEKEESQ